MKAADYLKALGVAILVLALNMLVLTACIFGWSMLVEPGHPPAYYSDAAPRLGAWIAPPTGALLLLLASWALGRRRTTRNPLLFAGVLWLAYAAIDILVALPLTPLDQVFTPVFALSMLAALTGSLVGGALAARSVPRTA